MAEKLNPLARMRRWVSTKTAQFRGYVKYITGTVTLGDARLGRFLGSATYAGKTVTEDTAIQLTAVWACVRLISEMLGSLPMQCLRREGDNIVPHDNDVAEVLLRSPNAELTTTELREAVGMGLCLRGASHHLVERTNSGRLISLTPLSGDTYPVRNKRTGAIEFNTWIDGHKETLPQEKVWHVRGFGGGMGLTGLPPITILRQALGLSMAAEEFQARFFSQGLLTNLTLSIPEWLTDEQRPAAKKKLAEIHAGLQNAHTPVLLEGGMKAETITMPLADAEFIASRKLQIAEIARIYRIPLHMIQEMEGSTNNNIEWQGQSLATHTLLPYFTRIESSISKWLLSPADRARGVFFRFNYEGLLRADTTARGEFYTKMLQNGVYNRNEVRGKENMPRVEGLDGYTVQLNMTPVELLQALAQAQIARNGGNTGGK